MQPFSSMGANSKVRYNYTSPHDVPTAGAATINSIAGGLTPEINIISALI